MQMLKTLWAAVQEDPKFRRRLNGWLTIFWIAMIPVSIVMGWITRSSSGRSSRVQALQLLARPRPDGGVLPFTHRFERQIASCPGR